MLLQDECGGGPHDKRHQRGDHSGSRKLETQSILEAGKYGAEDIAHRLFPGSQTDAEKDAEQIRS
eukprot:16300691-Heterocapsa_arctica.AAC.1